MRSWEVCHGRSVRVPGRLVRGQSGVMGEILRRKKKKQEHKVSYRCSLPSPLQKRSEGYQGLHIIPMNSRFIFEKSPNLVH